MGGIVPRAADLSLFAAQFRADQHMAARQHGDTRQRFQRQLQGRRPDVMEGGDRGDDVFVRAGSGSRLTSLYVQADGA